MARSYDANSYLVRGVTGILPAAFAVNSIMFAMRNNHASKIAYIDRLVVGFSATVAFTAGSQLILQMDRFSGGDPTGGQSYVPFEVSTGAPTSSMLTRVANTATLGGGAITLALTPVPLLSCASPLVSQYVGPKNLDFNDDPIRLLPGEGIAIYNGLVWPAAGTGIVDVMVGWFER